MESVVFHSEETGFTVMEVAVGDALTTVVGETSEIAEGEEITAQGNYHTHGTYGLQFRAQLISRTLPSSANAIRKYLSSRVIRGVGPATAGRIVEAFGDAALEIIEKEPERLTEVRGISAKKAVEIGEEFRRMFGIRRVMLFLSELGIDGAASIRIWKLWGERAVDVIRENPYAVCCAELEMDFEQADRLAGHFDIDADSDCRVEAGVQYILRFNSRAGHLCLPRAKLLALTSDYLQVPSARVDAAVELLLEDRTLTAYGEFIYLSDLYAAESYIAQRVGLMLTLPCAQPAEAVSGQIDEIEKERGVAYDELQRKAILAAVSNRAFILTGGPGTGKTTALNGIIAALEANGETVALAAPTGRAAQRMTEVTGREARTIHRLLEVEPHTSTLQFKRGEKNPLPCDAVIVDEMSMVDAVILERLLRAMKLGARLVMVGDSDQLPSVGAGNVLGDLIASGLVPTVHLDKVFRQASESLIVTNAHRIVSGELPDLARRDSDFFFLERHGAAAAQSLTVDLVARRLPARYGYSPLSDIQVIVPGKQGPLGTRELNRVLQQALNPPAPEKAEFTSLGRVFRQGDKVMQIRNNYDIVWTDSAGESGMGVFNGDIGTVEMIDLGSQTLLVRFDDRAAPYGFDACEQLELAYAVTVHKSQGSEFEAVVTPLERSHPRLLYRNLLYTGVTRARRLLILIGEKETVAQMVENDRRTRRYTNLGGMLQKVSEGNAV